MPNLIRTGSIIPPVETDEAKLFCRVDFDDEDPVVDGLLITATEVVETFLNRSCIDTLWTYYPEKFDDEIVIEMPWRTVDSIHYKDENGTDTLIATSVYQTDLSGLKALIKTKPNQSWPTWYHGWYKPITIVGKSGFGATKDSTPGSIKTAISLLANTFFNNRDLVVPGVAMSQMPCPVNVEYLLYPHKAATA